MVNLATRTKITGSVFPKHHPIFPGRSPDSTHPQEEVLSHSDHTEQSDGVRSKNGRNKIVNVVRGAWGGPMLRKKNRLLAV